MADRAEKHLAPGLGKTQHVGSWRGIKAGSENLGERDFLVINFLKNPFPSRVQKL